VVRSFVLPDGLIDQLFPMTQSVSRNNVKSHHAYGPNFQWKLE